MPMKTLYHYVPTAGVRADFKRLMNEFIAAKTVRYEYFSEIWRKRKFSYICAGRCTDRETREFLERIFLIAAEFFLPPYQFQVRVGGLYLLYGIFMTQPIAPKVKVRLTVSQWESTIQFQQEANEQNHLDVVYIFNRMLEDHAFQFCYTPTEMCENTLNAERDDNEINLADDMKDERREIDGLFDYESMEQLSYLLDHYHQMKVGMSSSKASKPDKSLDVVQGSMVEDLVGMLQSFKESCSNIYKHGTAHATAEDNDGPSGSDETILSKRKALKLKIYSGVDVNSPVKKSDPEESVVSDHTMHAPEKSQSQLKKSPPRAAEDDEDDDDVLVQYFTPARIKRGRGRPKKAQPPSIQNKKGGEDDGDGDENKDTTQVTDSGTCPRLTNVGSPKVRQSHGHPKKTKSPEKVQGRGSVGGENKESPQITDLEDIDSVKTLSSKQINMPTIRNIDAGSQNTVSIRVSSRVKKPTQKFALSLSDDKNEGKGKASPATSTQAKPTIDDSDSSRSDDDDYSDPDSEDDYIPKKLSKKQLRPQAIRKRMAPSKATTIAGPSGGEHSRCVDFVPKGRGRPRKVSPTKVNVNKSLEEDGRSSREETEYCPTKKPRIEKDVSSPVKSQDKVFETVSLSTPSKDDGGKIAKSSTDMTAQADLATTSIIINKSDDDDDDHNPRIFSARQQKSPANRKRMPPRQQDTAIGRGNSQSAGKVYKGRGRPRKVNPIPEVIPKVHTKTQMSADKYRYNSNEDSTINKSRVEKDANSDRLLSDTPAKAKPGINVLEKESKTLTAVSPVTIVSSPVSKRKGFILSDKSYDDLDTTINAKSKNRVLDFLSSSKVSQKPGSGKISRERLQNQGYSHPPTKKFKPDKTGTDFKNVFKNDLTSPLQTHPKSQESVDTAIGYKQQAVNVAKVPLSNILTGKPTGQMSTTNTTVKKPVKFIKIVAKSKAEAQEVLKSIEKQRASGDKLLSNLPSNCVQTISVGNRLPSRKIVVNNSPSTDKTKISSRDEPIVINNSESASSSTTPQSNKTKKRNDLVYVSM